MLVKKDSMVTVTVSTIINFGKQLIIKIKQLPQKDLNLIILIPMDGINSEIVLLELKPDL